MSAVWATNVGYFAGFLLVLRYFRSEVRSVHFAPVSLGDIKLIFEALSNGMATSTITLDNSHHDSSYERRDPCI